MIDIINEVNAIHRQVARQPGSAGEEVAVLVRRSYQAEVEEIWSALTEPERLARWFSPVTGEFKVGGSYQIQGNAGGEVLECEPPTYFKVTFGGPDGFVQIRVNPGAEGTSVLELEHTAPVGAITGSGSGALYVGPGWDLTLMGLRPYLAGELPADSDPLAEANSLEIQEFSKACIDAWVQVITASGTATDEEIAAAKTISLAQFSPDV